MQMERPHAEGDPYAMTAAFCQQLEMQMETANAADVAAAFRVCAFRSRSVSVPFPFRSSFCVRPGVPCLVFSRFQSEFPDFQTLSHQTSSSFPDFSCFPCSVVNSPYFRGLEVTDVPSSLHGTSEWISAFAVGGDGLHQGDFLGILTKKKGCFNQEKTCDFTEKW